MTLVFDFETSKNAEFSLPATHTTQPKPVQLAAILYDNERRQRASFCSIVKPAGWKIEPGAQAVHGISQEQAERFGIPQYFVSMQIRQLLVKATRVVTYNTQFDFLVMDHWFDLIGEKWRNGRAVGICPMKALTDAMRIPGPRGYKWPKLDEAFEFITGNPRVKEGSHDAMKDTLDAAQVYFGAVDKGYITEKNFQTL